MFGQSEREAEQTIDLLYEQERQRLLAIPQHHLYWEYTETLGTSPDFSLTNEELVEQIIADRRQRALA